MTLFAIIGCFAVHLSAQQTLTLQPGPEDGIDAKFNSLSPTVNLGGEPDIHMYAWTQSGNLNVIRSVIKFDLSTIPQSATVISAYLSLYYNPTSAFSTWTSPAAFYINRITTDWDELTVTWGTQPTSTNINDVLVPAASSTTASFPNIDVTDMVADMVADPTHSFGFLFRLVNENPYYAITLASSDNADSTIRPKLVITYSDPNSLPEENDVLQIKSFPNPANDVLSISFKNPGSENFGINILNSLGALVYSTETSDDNTSFNVADFENGMYFIQIIKDNQVVAASKFLKTE